MAFGALGDRGTTKALQTRFSLPPDFGLSLSPEIQHVITLDDYPELLYPQGWRRYMASATIGAVAAQAATVQIRMPRAATVICVIEGFWIGVANAEVVVSGIISTTDLTTVLGAQARDTRQVATKPGVCVVSTTTAAIGGTGGGGIFSVQSPVLPPIFPLILLPSLQAGVQLDGYSFQSTSVNQAYDVCLVYRERILQEQENSP